MNWVRLTKPMRGMKLTWTMDAFRAIGLRWRINGNDLHPWVEVPRGEERRGRIITLAVDTLPDDDPMFEAPRGPMGPAWWFHERRRLGECLGGLGVLASKFRRNLADTVRCVPDGASPYDCPYATGTIPTCPAQLWEACRPMVRLECFALGVSEALGARAPQSLWWAREIVSAVRARRGEIPEAIVLLTLFHVLAQWLTRGTMSRLIRLSDRDPRAIVEAVFEDPMEINSMVFPQILDPSGTQHLYPRGGAELN